MAVSVKEATHPQQEEWEKKMAKLKNNKILKESTKNNKVLKENNQVFSSSLVYRPAENPIVRIRTESAKSKVMNSPVNLRASFGDSATSDEELNCESVLETSNLSCEMNKVSKKSKPTTLYVETRLFVKIYMYRRLNVFPTARF